MLHMTGSLARLMLTLGRPKSYGIEKLVGHHSQQHRVQNSRAIPRRRDRGGDGLLNLMKFSLLRRSHHRLSPSKPSFMASLTTQTQTPNPNPTHEDNLDDLLCRSTAGGATAAEIGEKREEVEKPSFLGHPNGYLSGEARIERAWAHWRKLGQPALMVAPMVDCSELPFRMLCRKYGAQAAYTPMLHSRIFTENEKYRSMEFTTCQEDRPLFVQFCANDPDILLEAAKRVEPFCDYVDINLGCPQRIARRGNYGAFLMDKLPLVRSLVEKLARNLQVPVSCKIRIFPDLQDTLKYATMLEEAGCSLLAVHGRTRDQKDQRKIRADWIAIRAVRNAIRIPVLANGNIRHMDDVNSCLEVTGAEGVLSADALLENPALFAGFRTAEWAGEREDSTKDGNLDQAELLVEYLKLCEKYPVPWRMIRAHVHKMLGEWFREHPEVREDLNAQSRLTFEFLYDMVDRLRQLGCRIPLYVKESSNSEIVPAANGDVPCSL